jgi:hypothetical protein
MESFKAEKYEDMGKGYMCYDPPDMVPVYYKISKKTIKVSCEMGLLCDINYYLFKKNKDSERRHKGVIFKYHYKSDSLTLEFENGDCIYTFYPNKCIGTFVRSKE